MSTIEEVRVAENNVKNVLDALKKADKQDQNLQDRLSAELKSATDQYAKANSGIEFKAAHYPSWQLVDQVQRR